MHPEFVRLLKEADQDSKDSLFSPRAVMNRLYWKPPFRPDREEQLLAAIRQVHLGNQQFPGDVESSPNWPGFAPGRHGPVQRDVAILQSGRSGAIAGSGEQATATLDLRHGRPSRSRQLTFGRRPSGPIRAATRLARPRHFSLAAFAQSGPTCVGGVRRSAAAPFAVSNLLIQVTHLTSSGQRK